MRHALLFTFLFAALALGIPLAAVQISPLQTREIPAYDASVSAGAEKAVYPPEPSKAAEIPLSSAPALKIESTGSFRLYDRALEKTVTVDTLEYIRGAVASEMPASFHAQALSAQAVAAHTWAVYAAQQQAASPDPALSGADFSVDSQKCEGYMTKERFFERYGISAELLWPKICAAADYAEHRLLMYEGEPALAAYHSASAGMTEACENVWNTPLPYLVPVKSEGDPLSPDHSVTETFDKKTMRLLLEQAFPEAELDDSSAKNWITPLETSPSGYITLADVGGQRVHGQRVRTALGLRSSCFTVSFNSGTFSITTLGYGHGVGMSQYGADFMARQGSSCEQILSHYYPDTEVVTVSR